MSIIEIIKLSKKKSNENTAGKKNIIGAYIWNNISYLFTWLILPTSLSPNSISFISLIFAVIGFIIMCFADNTVHKIIGVVFFMLWAVFDCVDGNVARIKRQFSSIGDLWDAAAGYVAMSLMFLGIGICAFENTCVSTLLFVILGSLTSICSLLPRLLMHFRFHGEINYINNIRNYGFIKMIAFNLSSPDGFVLPLMLLSVIMHIESIYICCYFGFYLTICVYTCYSLLQE